jgi:hypothetical protein
MVSRHREHEERRAAQATVDAWKADVLQITDPVRRDVGLGAIERGIGSADPAVAAASIRALGAFRDIAYDRARFAPAVRGRLDDPHADVRTAALYALGGFEREPSDLERVLDILDAHPEDTATLQVAAWMSNRRVEGRLASLYVRALSAANAREGQDISNQLRGMWVTKEVEDAVLAVWRAKPPGEVGLWWHILGQIRGTREARVRALFEALLEDKSTSAAQLLERALGREALEPGVERLVADLAAESLATAPTAMTLRLFFRLLDEWGTAAHAPALRAYAANEMVAEAVRKEADQLATRLEQRR